MRALRRWTGLILPVAQIQRGASLPTLPLKHQNPGDVVHLAQLASKGRHILVTVPGAFTPSCSSQVPEFLSSLPRFAARDVLSINVLAVNDAFVTSAWGKSMLPHAESAAPIVRFLADDTGAFSDALGLLFDATGGLGNQRAKVRRLHLSSRQRD